MSEQAETSFHSSREALALDLADAVNAEIRDLFAAGADVVQIDEPWMERWPERSTRYGVTVLNRALEGVAGTVALHICFGYGSIVRDKRSAYRFLAELEDTPIAQVSLEAAQPELDLTQLEMLPSKMIALGVLDLSNDRVETPEDVARRIERALEHVPPERLIVAPDCGLKYLRRDVAVGKLRAMVAGAQQVRDALGA
jgi:5-methyltetrahydropteroyltriglutamate--homocysteine methyltransferase